MPGLSARREVYAFGLFLWGGVTGGLYTVGLATLAEKFHGEKLAAANAAYVMMYAWAWSVGLPALGFGSISRRTACSTGWESCSSAIFA